MTPRVFYNRKPASRHFSSKCSKRVLKDEGWVFLLLCLLSLQALLPHERAFANALGQHNGTMSLEAMGESPERALFGQCLASLKFILLVDGLGPTAAVQRGLVDS